MKTLDIKAYSEEIDKAQTLDEFRFVLRNMDPGLTAKLLPDLDAWTAEDFAEFVEGKEKERHWMDTGNESPNTKEWYQRYAKYIVPPPIARVWKLAQDDLEAQAAEDNDTEE